MKKFNFGKNWKKFLKLLNQERIIEAENSLKNMLKVKNLENKNFLDVGSGSGLFSLAARRLGAKVYSFDCDNNSVLCTNDLKNKFFKNDENWIVEKGDILDSNYVNKFEKFDVVYSWGVLHHTGDLNKALTNVSGLVKNNGMLFIALYNYQNYLSSFNIYMKKTYVNSGKTVKFLIIFLFILFQIIKGFIKDVLFLRNPFLRYKNKKKQRGMSVFYDWIDWVGGYPFEPSKPDEIINFFISKKFSLINIKTMGGGHGCNEFVFKKNSN